MLKKIEQSWQIREEGRLISNEYEHIPVKWEEIFLNQDEDTRNKIWLNYFPHISKEQPSKIAYTENPAKGEKDIQTQIKPGKFLRKIMPDMSDTEVQRLVQIFNGVSISGELRIATTEEHIVFVYLNGPNSCMGHKTSCYQTGSIHPVSVYGSGDIGVAYVENPRDSAKISARAVVNLIGKTYSRIYGESSMIKPLLEKNGWEYSDTALNGTRLLKRTNDYGDLIAPYLDGRCCEITVNGEYLHINEYDGDYTADNTNGLLSAGYSCHHCDCSIDENDCRSGGDYDYCDDCWNEFFFCCEDCSETTCNDEGVVIDGEGYQVCDHCFSNNYFTCGECNENNHKDNYYATHDNKGSICDSCDHYFILTECCDTLFHDSENGCDCEKEEEEEEEAKKEVTNNA
jgi:hypothetical protein